jgi:hypothetical protein
MPISNFDKNNSLKFEIAYSSFKFGRLPKEAGSVPAN